MKLPLMLLVSALLAGCASYQGIFPVLGRLSPVVTQAPFSDWPKEDWWKAQHDAELSALIESSLQDSPSLQAASARLARVRAISGQAESALWPQLNAGLSSTHQRFTESGLIPPPYAGTLQDMNDLQLSGVWELDFFGRNRENLQAALGMLRASEAEQQAARILLASNVARGYYNLARLLGQHEFAVQRLQIRQDLATRVERRFKAGLDSGVELEAAQVAVPEIARDIEALNEQISLARHGLAVLSGKTPAALDALAPILPPVATQPLPKALPVNLLGHRADVVAARYRVESVTHLRESSKALFYPNIDLRVFTGYSSIGFDHWLDNGSRQPGAGLAVSLPIFDAGRLRNQFWLSTADIDVAVAAYNGTLLDALREVADQLSALQSIERQLIEQDALLASARHSHELALQRYHADLIDRLVVLNAETALLNQRRAALDLQGRWIDARLRLIQALGGGYIGQTSITDTLSENQHEH